MRGKAQGRASDAGADALVVSNHGGRQLDGDLPTIAALPTVMEKVGGRLEVLLDGGICRGQSVVKAMALGAEGCLVGRAFLYGLASAGERGVALAIEILKAEIDATIAHIGINDVRELARRRAEFLITA